MKVAILNRPPGEPLGGDRIAIRYTVDALKRVGVHAECLWGSGMERLQEFDLAHVFHVNFNFCRENYRKVHWARMPYVVTPIYYPEYEEMTHQEQLSALWGAEQVIPFSRTEGAEITAKFGVICADPIPNGTAEVFHAMPSERFGVCASDWGGTKHTDAIKQACDWIGLPFKRFKDVPHDRLPAEYRKYRVFASATTSDRMSLAVGEALCSGCRCVVSTANRGNEWYPGLVTVAPDASVEEWQRQLQRAYYLENWDWRPNNAARCWTWDLVARNLKERYERVLN